MNALPADRFLQQQTWWVVSELVRRHPDLRVTRSLHPSGGWLVVITDPDVSVQIIFDLTTGIQAHESGVCHFIPWDVVFAQPNAEAVVHKIESMTSLPLRHPEPGVSEYSIGFQLIAALLSMYVNDSEAWTVVQIALEPILAGGRPDSDPLLQPFPSACDDLVAQRDAAHRSHGPHATIHPYLWGLVREVNPVMIIDTDGCVHLHDGVFSTMDIYEEAHGDVRLAALTMLQWATADEAR